MLKTLLTLGLTIVFQIVIAQSSDTLRVSAPDTLTVFAGDTLTVFGSVKNAGTIHIKTGGVIQFFGESWTNESGANVIGDGRVIFRNNLQQAIYAGNDGYSFPNIVIDNLKGVLLQQFDARIKDTIELVNGHILLNNNNLTLGNETNAGVILGFNENRFIVTNSDVSDAKGFFYRLNIEQSLGEIAFPIGKTVGDYTPAVVGQQSIQKDTIGLRIFVNDVLTEAQSGNSMAKITVGKTWQLKSSHPDIAKTIKLQHNQSSEGTYYRRNQQYIGEYVGTIPNFNGGAVSLNNWDRVEPTSANSSSGTITTGSPLANAFVGERNFSKLAGNSTFLTKMTSENHAPFATDDINIAFQNTPFIGDVLTNDVDIDGDSIFISTQPITEPQHGQLTLLENGSYSYVPDPDFLGEDTFSYLVCDNGVPSLCDTGHVTIYIISPTELTEIIAINDYVAIKFNTTVEINAIENDFFPAGQPKSFPHLITAVTAHGTAWVTATGTIGYQPQKDYIGRDEIFYYICDFNNNCDTAKITIDIRPFIVIKVDAPIAVDDAFQTTLNKPIHNSVYTNDLSIKSNYIFANLSNPHHGTLDFKPNGAFSYFPTIGYIGTDLFTYQVCDDNLPVNCSKATVYFVIRGAACTKSKVCTPVVIKRKVK